MWKRKHKDVSKMENTFPSANQTSKHICSWKTRKLGFCTKPKRCSSDSFNSLLPNLRSLNLSGDFKSILEAWQKILPISLPSKIHTLQVPEAEEAQGGRHSLRHHTKHHSTKKNPTETQPTNHNKKPTPNPPQKQAPPPLCTDKLHLTFSDGVISLLLEHTELRQLLFLHRQSSELRVKSQFPNAIFNIFPTETRNSKHNRWKKRIQSTVLGKQIGKAHLLHLHEESLGNF